MKAVVEVLTEAKAVRVTRGGFEFWAPFGSIDAAYRAWEGTLHGDAAAMDRAERSLIDRLNAAAPVEGLRDGTSVLAQVMGLWLFQMEVGDWPDETPEERAAWTALANCLARGAVGPSFEPSDRPYMREVAAAAGVPYVDTDTLRLILEMAKKQKRAAEKGRGP
jgi:hypothetical protein